jgi:hypothetical protein
MMIFVIGLFPNIFLSQIKDAAARVQDDMDGRAMMNPGPTYYEGPIKLTSPKHEQPRLTEAAQANAAGQEH